MTQRYVLHPGPVTCAKNGQMHFIGASTLARLYGVEMRDCIVFDPDPHNRTEDYSDCIHLHPQYDEDCTHTQVVALGERQSTESSNRAR
jgi:hypothetical protein